VVRTDENTQFKLHKTPTRDWYIADEVDQRIAELEAENAMLRETRVPDELLAEIISEAEELNRYRPGWELKIKPYRAGHTVSVIEKAQAILDKRREAK